MQKQTVAETVAGNIRAYRQLRGLEQAALARRMQSLRVPWHRATVSEVERNQRSVTITELLALTVALGTTIEDLVHTPGPGGRRGPNLLISDQPPPPAGPVIGGHVVEPFDRRIDLPPASVSALVCPHKLYAETEWIDNVFSSILIQTVEEQTL
jgi:transcriptional regulator with XRE-family HTH domain